MGRYDRSTTLTDQSGDPINVGNPLPTTSGGGGGGGTSQADKSSFAEGSGIGTPIMGVFNDSLAAPVTEDRVGAVRITSYRGIHCNLRDDSGVELGTASSPLRVDPTGSTVQPVSGTVTVTDGGGSITVDGTIAATQSGSWTVAATQSGSWSVSITGSVTVADLATADYDTGAGTVTQAMIGIALPASGGPVAGGTATNPIRTDPTGTTAQPVTDGGGSLTVDGSVSVTGTVGVTQSTSPWVVGDGGGSLTVDGPLTDTELRAAPVEVDASGTPVPVTDNGDSLTVDGTVSISGTVTVSGTVAATQSGTWAVQITDGSLTASVRNTGSNDSLNVAIVDASGNHITSFGGGTQYTEGDIDATPTGTVAMWRDSSDDSLHGASDAEPFPVTIISGGGGGMTDDSTFTPGSSTVVPMGAYVDDTGTDSVDEGDIGAPRMSAARLLYVTTAPSSSVVVSDGGGAITVDGTVAVSGTVTVTGTVAISGTVTVDTEMAAAAALSDTFANPTTTQVGAFVEVWSGSVWERWITVNGANGTTGAGIPAVAGLHLNSGDGNYYRTLSVASATGGLDGTRTPTAGMMAYNGVNFQPIRVDSANNLRVLTPIDSQSGSISTLNGTVTFDLDGYNTAKVSLSGTWTATVSFLGSNDGGVTFHALQAVRTGTQIRGTSTTTTGMYEVDVAGYTRLVVQATAFSSGPIAVVMTAGVGSNGVAVMGGVPIVDFGGDSCMDETGNALKVVPIAGDLVVGRVKITDGTTVATVRELGANDAVNVAICDGSGNQITTFGGSSHTDDAAFAPGVSTGSVMFGFADETSSDSVDEGDAGALRMTLDRVLRTVGEIENGHCRVNGSRLVVKRASIDITATGNQTVIAAVASHKLRILTLQFVSSVLAGVQLKSGTSTVVVERLTVDKRIPLYLEAPPQGYLMETASGEAFVMNTDNAGLLRGIVTYIEVP